ncbi:MAG: SDR family NAD(P)-dependent oxidoreductase [Rhodoferax sp.]
MLLANKTAVVTGANRGIGLAIVRLFAQQGCHVHAAVRTVDDAFAGLAAQWSQEYGVKVTPLALDLSSEDSVKAAVRSLAAAGPLDVLVNNAGVASGALAQMTPMADMRRLFEVNFFAPIALTQGVSRIMARRRSGSVVFLSSVAAQRADPGTLAYGCSKAAVERAVKSLATELGAANIRVNGIAPNVTRTDMAEQMDPAAREALLAATALRRMGEPDEIAKVALFLASDLSSYVTGQILHADGGMT